jgi:hypothetical protein
MAAQLHAGLYRTVELLPRRRGGPRCGHRPVEPAAGPHLRRSLTWDQGSEMALHDQIARALDIPVFFCAKASPWQRPSNENTY